MGVCVIERKSLNRPLAKETAVEICMLRFMCVEQESQLESSPPEKSVVGCNRKENQEM